MQGGKCDNCSGGGGGGGHDEAGTHVHKTQAWALVQTCKKVNVINVRGGGGGGGGTFPLGKIGVHPCVTHQSCMALFTGRDTLNVFTDTQVSSEEKCNQCPLSNVVSRSMSDCYDQPALRF